MKKKSEKRKLWERIQKECPDMAEFIQTVSEVFGKPARLKVTFNNKGKSLHELAVHGNGNNTRKKK